jgi:2-polyprenyl-3-methyl-5-hydroxy-6-metoxy-1,4-benzoquinol methylase
MTRLNASSIRPNYHALVRHEVGPLHPEHARTLIDIGGGVGATAAHLKAMGRAALVGVVDMVNPNGSESEIDFRYTGNVEDQSFLDRIATEKGPFDVILLLDVLEHLVDPWTLVERAHRMLRKNGIIVASIPNIRHYSALVPLLLRNEWELKDAGILDRTHLRFFVKRSAIDLMTSSGLVLEEVRPAVGGGRKVTLFRKATLGLLNSFSDMQYLIRVRRVDS